jgi:DNA-binding MarR family transcriptional regulator
MNLEELSIARCISVLHRYRNCYVGKRLESSGISSGQSVILLTLFYQGGVSQEELADALKTDKGSIAKYVKKLEDEAFVERRADASDKRAYKVSLTQKGLDAIPAVQDAIARWEEFITSGLSADEKQALGCLLQKMVGKAITARTAVGEKVL